MYFGAHLHIIIIVVVYLGGGGGEGVSGAGTFAANLPVNVYQAWCVIRSVDLNI